ncbi:MAG: FAD-dependent oxidoreductase [Phycisphaerales bacterium]|nr:FAD-dependent oxidoreductase [Phycisphaerales bacterium]
MKIAVIGSGISGLTAASQLDDDHEVHLFEAQSHAGGHTRTIPVQAHGRTWPVDTGFVVFNTETYPGLCGLFDSLGLKRRETSMSFSVKCPRTGFEYQGAGLSGFYASRRNLLNPVHHLMLRDIIRFHKDARSLLQSDDDTMTLDDWIEKRGYNKAFRNRYLLPIGSSIWSCSRGDFGRFPARFVIEFMTNHRMLQIGDRPIWQTLTGGSDSYVDAMLKRFNGTLHLDTPVQRTRRTGDGVDISIDGSGWLPFDHVVVACHADQALDLVESPDDIESELLECFPYSPNLVTLHTDQSRLPRRPAARASWNYLLGQEEEPASLTYDMSRLQGLDSPEPFLVTLNDNGTLDESRILLQFETSHPTYHSMRAHAQARHGELINRGSLSYCGAYWGYGFHEDRYQSGLRAAEGILTADRTS